MTDAADAPLTVAAPIEIDGSGVLGLYASGALAVDAPITVTGAGHVSLAYDTSDPSNLSFGLTATGFTNNLSFTGGLSAGPSLTINGDAYTLLYSMGAVQGINNSATTLQDHYALATSLDAATDSTTPASWVPIGNGNALFTGSFEGLGHVISKLTIDEGLNSIVGLFGGLAYGTIRDVGLVGGSVRGLGHVGDLAGYQFGGSIANVYATGAVSGQASSAG